MTAISWNTGTTGDWSVAANWSPSFVPTAGDAVTVADPGSYTVTISQAEAAGALTINAAGATVSDQSTLTLGGVLVLEAGVLALSGVLTGGTVTAEHGSLLCQSGTFAGVTYEGTLDLSASSANLTFSNNSAVVGSSGFGPGDIELTGTASDFPFPVSTLNVITGSTLDNAIVHIGSDGLLSNSIAAEDLSSSGAPVTLGAGLNIDQTGTHAVFLGSSFLNRGKIDLGFIGGNFIFESLTFDNEGTIAISNGEQVGSYGRFINGGIVTVTDSSLDTEGPLINDGGITLTDCSIDIGALLTNAGTITVAGGTLGIDAGLINHGRVTITDHSTLDLESRLDTATLNSFDISANSPITIGIDGTLNNSGTTLTLAERSSFALSLGTIIGGTVDAAGGTLLPQGGTLSGVTYEGTLNLANDGADLVLAGNTAITGPADAVPGNIQLTGNNAYLFVLAGSTLDNTTIDIGSNDSSDSALLSYDPFYTNSPATLGTNVSIIQTGSLAFIGGTYPYTPGALVLRGRVQLGFADGSAQLGTGQNVGIIDVSNGEHLTNDYTFLNSGVIDVNSGTLAFDAQVTNTGSIIVDGGGMVALYDSDGTVAFGTRGGALDLDQPSFFSGAITNFGPGDTLDLTGEIVTSASITPAGTLVANLQGGGTQTFTLAGTFTPGTLSTTPDTSNGTSIIVPCYAAGTRIATPTGEVPVETIRANDRVLTAAGRARRVVWAGRRQVDCARHPDPDSVRPSESAPTPSRPMSRRATSASRPTTRCASTAAWSSPDGSSMASASRARTTPSSHTITSSSKPTTCCSPRTPRRKASSPTRLDPAIPPRQGTEPTRARPSPPRPRPGRSGAPSPAAPPRPSRPGTARPPRRRSRRRRGHVRGQVYKP